MGIKGLWKLIQKTAPSSVIVEKNLRGKRVVLDVPLVTYSFMISIRGKNNGMDLVTSSGRLSSHIYGAYNWIMNLIEFETESVWIFDGPPPEIKVKTLKKRAMTKKKASKRLEDYNDAMADSDIVKCKKKTVRVNSKIRNEIQELLGLFGMPYLNAISEGEMQCAAFGKTHWTISEDWDTLVFGASNMIKQISFEKGTFMRISLRDMLDKLGLTHEQFIEMCIFMGCDYCDKIEGIDFEVYEVYKQFKNASLFLEYLNQQNSIHLQETGKIKYIIPEDFEATFDEVKSFYSEGLVINPDSDKLRLDWRKPDYEGLTTYLCDKFEMDYEQVQRDLRFVSVMYDRYINNKRFRGASYSNHFSFSKKW